MINDEWAPHRTIISFPEETIDQTRCLNFCSNISCVFQENVAESTGGFEQALDALEQVTLQPKGKKGHFC